MNKRTNKRGIIAMLPMVASKFFITFIINLFIILPFAKIQATEPNNTGQKAGPESFTPDQYREMFAQEMKKTTDPYVGRTEIIRLIQETFESAKLTNFILTSEAGEGKTSLVEALNNKADPNQIRFYKLEVNALLAGASYEGEKESRISGIIEGLERLATVNKARGIMTVLYVDEVHTIVGSGSNQKGSDGLEQKLKEFLTRPDVRVIGTTTLDEYREYIEKDAAVTSRFLPRHMDKLTSKELLSVLKAYSLHFMRSTGFRIDPSALEFLVEKTARYVPDVSTRTYVQILDKAFASLKAFQKYGSAEVFYLEAKVNELKVDVDFYKMGLEIDPRNPDYKNSLNSAEAELKNIQHVIAGLKATEAPSLEVFRISAELKRVQATADRLLTTEPENHKRIVEQIIPEIETRLAKAYEAANLDQEKLKKLNVIGTRLVAKSIADQAVGFTVEDIIEGDRNKIDKLEERLNQRVVGNQKAKLLVAETIRNQIQDIKENRGVQAAILLDGASGVGKSHFAKELAKALGRVHIRIDLSGYTGEMGLNKLFGVGEEWKGGGKGGLLTNKIRNHPHAVLSLEEINQAGKGVIEMLYQILENGGTHDGNKRWISFKDVIIIGSTNTSAAYLATEKGSAERAEFENRILTLEEQKERDPTKREKLVTRQLLVNDGISLALQGRHSAIINMHQLTPEQAREVARITLEVEYSEYNRNKYGAEIKFSNSLVDSVARFGYEAQYGARSMNNFMNEHVLTSLAKAKAAIGGKWGPGDVIFVDYRENQNRSMYEVQINGQTVYSAEKPLDLTHRPDPAEIHKLRERLRGIRESHGRSHSLNNKFSQRLYSTRTQPTPDSQNRALELVQRQAESGARAAVGSQLGRNPDESLRGRSQLKGSAVNRIRGR